VGIDQKEKGVIEQNYFLTNTLLMIIGTVCIRGSFIAFASRLKITPITRELFTFIPAAILPALFIPATFFHQGQMDLMAGKERFIVLMICLGATYFIRNTLFCVGLGLSLLYALHTLTA
jgi:branched-subunit amino acid transport protein